MSLLRPFRLELRFALARQELFDDRRLVLIYPASAWQALQLTPPRDYHERAAGSMASVCGSIASRTSTISFIAVALARHENARAMTLCHGC
jgi:hypothetical protein